MSSVINHPNCGKYKEPDRFLCEALAVTHLVLRNTDYVGEV